VAGRRRGRLTTVTRGCSGGPARGCAREEKMLWTRGARVSKEDHRATAEHVLRPGEALRARAGAGDAGGTCGGSGGGGATWRGGSRLARGRGAAVRVLGWHVAQLRAARGGGCAAHGRRGWRQSGAEKTEEEGAGGRRWGLICYFPKVQGLLYNA
jgi:hypothetical protein